MAIATILLLALPWVFVVLTLVPGLTRLESIVLGLTGGLAAMITAGHLLASLGRLEAFPPVYAVAVFLAIATALWTVRCRPSRESGKGIWSAGERSTMTGGEVLWFAAVLATVAGLALIPVLTNDFPLGWDPSFHAILAEKIRLSGALSTDWQPFEPIPLNYPQGTHLLLAIAARLTGLPVHRVFPQLLVVAQVLSTAMVGLIARRIFPEWGASVGALISYAFLVRWGGFVSYFQWGGLPTAIGALFFLGLVLTGLAERGRRGVALGSVLLGSLLITHHLTAMIAATVAALYLLLEAIELAGSRRSVRRGLDGHAVFMVRVGLTALVLYSFFVVPYAFKARHLAETAAIQYSEEPLIRAKNLPLMLGWTLLPTALAGIVLSRRVKTEDRVFLLIWTTALALGFTLLDDAYRLAANLLYRRDFTAFTPSRFLTLMSYPLAVFSGYTFSTLLRAGPNYCTTALPLLKTSLARNALLAVLFVASVSAAVPGTREISQQRVLPQSTIELAAMVKRHTPENAFVVYDGSLGERNLHWMPYLTWRRTVQTPIPASESQVPLREREKIFRSPGDWQAARRWLSEQGLRGFVLSRKPEGIYHLGELTESGGGR